MSDAFDPYRKWLGIPPAEQPPHHYRLLGIGLYEDDPDVIESAADQRMAHLRTFQAGPHSALSQKLLNEIVVAKICLLSPDQRAAYDIELRQRLSPPEAAVERPMPAAAPVAVAPFGEDLLETAIASIPASRQLVGRPDGKSQKGRPLAWWLAGAGGLFALVVAALVIFGGPEAPPRVANPPAEPPARPTSATTKTPAMQPKQPSPQPSPIVVAPEPGPPLTVAPFDAQVARAHQEAWAAYLKTPVEQTNSIGMSLVLIPPGEFTMGSTPEQIAAAKEFARQTKKLYLDWTLERIDAEAPAHRVKLSRPFLMGATEVTIGQYRRFVEATGYETETERFGGGSSTSRDEQDPKKKALSWRGPSHPANDRSAVVEITWNDAIAFCNWLSESEKKRHCYQQNEQGHWILDRAGDGYRLPTEAEWEYACRAGAMTQYAFGDDSSALGQYGWSDKTGPMTFPVAVGSKLPNSFGLYDMHGNAEEWCCDWFAPEYYAESLADDPAGPASGDHRIKRGGTWDGPIVNCRAAFRGSYPPHFRFGDLGFRVMYVSTAAETPAAPTDPKKAAAE